MELPNNIKSEPFWWKFFPKARGRTILNTIYIKKEMYDDLRSKNPKPESLAVLLHEQTHVERIHKIGTLKFSAQYLLSGKFRFYEELEANKQAFKVLKRNRSKVDIDRKAKILSSWRYLWPVNYQFAKKELERAWELA